MPRSSKTPKPRIPASKDCVNVRLDSKSYHQTCNISEIIHEDVLHDGETALGVDVTSVGGAGAGDHHDGGGPGAARGGGHHPHVPPVSGVGHTAALELLHDNSFLIAHNSQILRSPPAHNSRFA